jgi:hypothetical protein
LKNKGGLLNTTIINDVILQNTNKYDIDIFDFFNNNYFIKYIKNENGFYELPNLLYICKTNSVNTEQPILYENIIKPLNNEIKMSLIDNKIEHPLFGYFYFFSSTQLNKEPQSYKKYAVFINKDNDILYILKDINSINVLKNEDNDEIEFLLDYDEIYFHENNQQLWCIKSNQRFTELLY